MEKRQRSILQFTIITALTLGLQNAYAALPECAGGMYRMVVPAAAGGTTDIVGRLIAAQLGEKTGKSVVVENRPGGGGTIGAGYVAASKPDGCTMLMGNIGPNAINYALNKNLTYTHADLQPVTSVFAVPNVLVLHPNVKATTVKELVALAKAAPGTLALANSGVGQSTHMTGEMFRLATGVDVISVPYKGNAPAVADLLGGQVHMMFDNVAVSLPHIQSGKLRPLAVTSKTRVSGLPDVPTMEEAGLEGFDVAAWFGLFYPSGTNNDYVVALQKHVAEILELDSVKQQISSWSGVPGGESTDAFSSHVKSEIEKWATIVNAAQLSID